jgi:hypothetical protein
MKYSSLIYIVLQELGNITIREKGKQAPPRESQDPMAARNIPSSPSNDDSKCIAGVIRLLLLRI